MKKICLVSGTSSLSLSKKISDLLDVELVNPQIKKFANGETFCELEKNVRGADVFLIQSLCNSINDSVMELLIILDALKRASASNIIAVLPHYGYSRQDRKVSPRTPITAKLIADLITVAGATRVITVDLHAGQIQGFFNIPFDNIYASPVLLKYISEVVIPKSDESRDNFICVSPDSGGVERVRSYAKKLKCDLAMIDKRRLGPNIAQAMNVVGNVEGKNAIIIDDIIDTAGTLVQAAVALKEKGAKDVYACAAHGIFSSPALDNIERCENLKEVIVTDTIPMLETTTKIKVLSVAEILSKAIHRTFNDESVSSLFA